MKANTHDQVNNSPAYKLYYEENILKTFNSIEPATIRQMRPGKHLTDNIIYNCYIARHDIATT